MEVEKNELAVYVAYDPEKAISRAKLVMYVPFSIRMLPADPNGSILCGGEGRWKWHFCFVAPLLDANVSFLCADSVYKCDYGGFYDDWGFNFFASLSDVKNAYLHEDKLLHFSVTFSKTESFIMDQVNDAGLLGLCKKQIIDVLMFIGAGSPDPSCADPFCTKPSCSLLPKPFVPRCNDSCGRCFIPGASRRSCVRIPIFCRRFHGE